MELIQWLTDDLVDLAGRLRDQVRAHVPPDRRAESNDGGTPILWNTFHIARHSALALTVLTGEPTPEPDWLAALGEDAGAGLQEAMQPWGDRLRPDEVDDYVDCVLVRATGYLAGAGPDLDAVPPTAAALRAAGIDEARFDWLYRMWIGKPAAWLVRWPLLGHSTSHIGEMLATRNRMGLSPF